LLTRHLRKLSTNRTSRVRLGVAIGEEAAWVGNNLADMEASSVVSTCSVVDAHEEGASQATIRDTAVVRSLGIWECKTRRTSLALDALVDVCCGHGRGHVLARYTGESDVLFARSAYS
jgi:hypothetical protein